MRTNSATADIAGRRVPTLQCLLGSGDDGLMVHGSGSHDREGLRTVPIAIVPAHIRTGHGGDAVHRADNRRGQRRTLEYQRREVLRGATCRVVFHHGDLFEDHPALQVHVRSGDDRINHHVQQHAQRQVSVLVAHSGVEAGVLLAGEGVEITADAFDTCRDLQRRTPPRALEEQML